MAWAPIAQADADLFENPTLQAIAESHGRTVAQVALRYLIQRGIIAIPKTTHIDRMKENLDIFDFELSAAEMDSIRPLDRPREFQGRTATRSWSASCSTTTRSSIRPTNNPARKRNTKGTDGVFVVRPFLSPPEKGRRRRPCKLFLPVYTVSDINAYLYPWRKPSAQDRDTARKHRRAILRLRLHGLRNILRNFPKSREKHGPRSRYSTACPVLRRKHYSICYEKYSSSIIPLRERAR